MKKITVLMMATMIIAMAGAAMAGDTNTLTVSANVVGTCKFNTAAETLAFGALDPSVGGNVNGSTSANFWCTKGTVESFLAGNGNNWSGTSRQMKDTVSGDVIPYSLALTPDGNPNNGPGSPRTLTIGGQVLGTDYLAKSAGNYSDTVLIDINP